MRVEPGLTPQPFAAFVADTTASTAEALGGVTPMFREAGFVILNIGAYEMGAGATCSLAGGGAAAERSEPVGSVTPTGARSH